MQAQVFLEYHPHMLILDFAPGPGIYCLYHLLHLPDWLICTVHLCDDPFDFLFLCLPGLFLLTYLLQGSGVLPHLWLELVHQRRRNPVLHGHILMRDEVHQAVFHDFSPLNSTQFPQPLLLEFAKVPHILELLGHELLLLGCGKQIDLLWRPEFC